VPVWRRSSRQDTKLSESRQRHRPAMTLEAAIPTPGRVAASGTAAGAAGRLGRVGVVLFSTAFATADHRRERNARHPTQNSRRVRGGVGGRRLAVAAAHPQPHPHRLRRRSTAYELRLDPVTATGTPCSTES